MVDEVVSQPATRRVKVEAAARAATSKCAVSDFLSKIDPKKASLICRFRTELRRQLPTAI